MGDANTGCVSRWFSLDQPGWIVALCFASYDGTVHLVRVGVHSTQGLDPNDVVMRAQEVPLPPTPPDRGFRYRWLRDIGQQYEQTARRELRAQPEVLVGLQNPDWYLVDAPKKGRGVCFYAEVAHDFVELNGSTDQLAEQRCVARDTAAGWIKKARRMDLLTSPGQGRRGHSDLTQRAQEVLRGEH